MKGVVITEQGLCSSSRFMPWWCDVVLSVCSASCIGASPLFPALHRKADHTSTTRRIWLCVRFACPSCTRPTQHPCISLPLLHCIRQPQPPPLVSRLFQLSDPKSQYRAAEILYCDATLGSTRGLLISMFRCYSVQKSGFRWWLDHASGSFHPAGYILLEDARCEGVKRRTSPFP